MTGQVGFKDDGSYKREFKGWKPGCSCDVPVPPVPCVVLDPFMGSGTVAVVARELNRSSIGIELNPEYVKIIKKRLQAGSCLDTGVVNYHFEKASP
ncbi:MAG: DNA methyltransferase [Methanoregula sp.]|uniref:DNA methyltransferase n=1 Tax=Methanoregula sp. TaxID=2052170 RepID=UPI003D0C83AE